MKTSEPRSTVTSSTLARLRHEIVTGHIAPGERLNLDQLRGTYDVSLSPLREALARLVSEGLVLQADDQRGFQVPPVSRANLLELTALRKTLEVMALRLAMDKGDDGWESDMVVALHRLGRLKAKSADKEHAVDEEWERWHRRFHSSLIGGCKSPVLLQFCETLHDLSDRYRRIFIHLPRKPRDVHSEHLAIADAAMNRDIDKACRLMEQHIDLTASPLLAALAE